MDFFLNDVYEWHPQSVSFETSIKPEQASCLSVMILLQILRNCSLQRNTHVQFFFVDTEENKASSKKKIELSLAHRNLQKEHDEKVLLKNIIISEKKEHYFSFHVATLSSSSST